jgi:hypothetical protein
MNPYDDNEFKYSQKKNNHTFSWSQMKHNCELEVIN